MPPGTQEPDHLSPSSDDSSGFVRASRKAFPFLFIFFIFLTYATFPAGPRSEGAPACDADPSLSLILDDARARGIQFGTEHVYTYGPLGFTIFFLYAPRFAWAHMVVDILLGLVVATGLWMLGSRLKAAWRTALIVIFTWAAANFDPRVDFLVNVGILCFGLVCLTAEGRRLFWSCSLLVLLASFAALAKNSFLVVATFSILLTSGSLFLKGDRRVATGVVIGYVLFFVAGWGLCGQSIGNLKPFLLNALEIVRGYNGALGWETQSLTTWVGALALALSSTTILSIFLVDRKFTTRSEIWKQTASLMWIGALQYAAWKHGFVRAHPSHMSMFFGFMAVTPIATLVLSSQAGASGRGVRILAVSSALFCVGALQWFFFPPVLQSAAAPLSNAVRNFGILLSPSEYYQTEARVIERQQIMAQLPNISRIVGNASVDVFGQQQAYALYNHLNYSPRPVPQSYAACSADLMELNQRFYLSPAAPEYVMFELASIDRKFPTLDDARVLRHLLINYRPVADEGSFVLLKQVSRAPVKLTLLTELQSGIGNSIDLRPYQNAPLWIEIRMKASFAGRIRQLMLRPPPVRLTAWGEPGKQVLLRRRAPASMLSAGFLATPLLVGTPDVMRFYSGNAAITPGAYTVDVLPGEEYFWEPQVSVALYRVENLGQR